MIKRSTNRISEIRGLSLGAFFFLPLKPSLINFSCGLTANPFLISLAGSSMLVSRGGKARLALNSKEMGEMSLTYLVLSRKVYEAQGVQNLSSIKIHRGWWGGCKPVLEGGPLRSR